jgi:serine-type D-Ala-D-Ala carboxypeptidase/endopeptidase (penicillin-binding protein 4)
MGMRRAVAVTVLALFVVAGPSVAAARAPWKRRIDRAVGGRSVGIAITLGDRLVYGLSPRRKRVPASNEKLLTSMALFDTLGPQHRLTTTAVARRRSGSTIEGNLWVLGRGDPAVATPGPFARALPFSPTRIGVLARRIVAAGVTRVAGRVLGSTGYFRHDWYAPGWKPFFPSLYVALPSALTFAGNTVRGRHISDPERRVARSLTRRLEHLGVSVSGRPGSAHHVARGSPVARVRSRPLETLVRYMDRKSSNFFAEVLGKRLSVELRGRPGTIAGAGRALTRWAADRGVKVHAVDSSGLSYRNRISPLGIVRLLRTSESEEWGQALWSSLAGARQGTLADRLAGIRIRAKTGTLDGISALSGWVWMRHRGAWARFSILSRGMPKSRAVAMEDRIVRTIAGAGAMRARRWRSLLATLALNKTPA